MSKTATNGNRITELEAEPRQQSGRERIVIARPRLMCAKYHIVGTAPYVQHAFGAKARKTLLDPQIAVEGNKSAKKQRKPRKLDDEYKDALHESDKGWHGIPAPAFRAAMIDACRLANYKMTFAKLSVFIEADGFDKADGTPLVKIVKGKPIKHMCTIRLDNGQPMERIRPMWKSWECDLRVRFDADQFSAVDVANLLMRAGAQVGVGEGRPFSKNSAGMGWGLFEIANSGKAVQL